MRATPFTNHSKTGNFEEFQQIQFFLCQGTSCRTMAGREQGDPMEEDANSDATLSVTDDEKPVKPPKTRQSVLL